MPKKVFVTGATGFIGANLVHRLLKEGFEVHIGTRKSSNKWRIQDVLPDVVDHDFDLLDAYAVKNLLLRIKPNIICNLAIYGGYPNQLDTQKIINTNFIGTVNLLNACEDIDYDCFIQVGSSSEYGPKKEKMSENMLLEPTTTYGVSKAAASTYAQFIAKTKDKPIVVVRPFSPFGYFEEPTRLIPSLIKSCLENHNPELASPSAVRDFIFVEDLIDAFMLITQNVSKVKGEILNIGRGEQISVEEIAKIIISLTNLKLFPKFGMVKPRIYDSHIWLADISKIKKLLGWKPKTDIKTGLKKTIQWFKENKKIYSLR